MRAKRLATTLAVGSVALLVAALLLVEPNAEENLPAGRSEVVFWHFWGGADREVVERVVARFNARQDRYWVRAVAMPGNNLDLKLFLAVTGGDPPDLINQDDPIMADWAARGALLPLDELATPQELAQLERWLVPAARRLATYQGHMYALCNGLDIRALYYNRTILDEYGFAPPQNLGELDRIAVATTEFEPDGRAARYGYLPDPRRLWAWGIVFGGNFYDPQRGEVTLDSPEIVRALEWMASYRQRFGAAALSAFRQGDQSLPGKTFPLLAGRYTMLMDGQWRVRDILAAQEDQRRRGVPVTQYGVCALPPPPGGRHNAGWVNGNFFLVPRGADNARGAWEFMKFWSGFGGNAAEAAETCLSGGWIPVSRQVAEQPRFVAFLKEQPLFAQFVELSAAEYQIPTPVIPGAPLFQRTVNDAASTALYEATASPPRQILQEADRLIQSYLDRLQTARAQP